MTQVLASVPCLSELHRTQRALYSRNYNKSISTQILSMIEEAAGTRLYESKKASAQKTIVKKEGKLQEIQTVKSNSVYSGTSKQGTLWG